MSVRKDHTSLWISPYPGQLREPLASWHSSQLMILDLSLLSGNNSKITI
ncbi:MAG TPA: hypothetical protein VNB91_08735 [Jatrophihabitantaceae bacterium]|jgi:hypothetical protein|nr:hypothetical protein [Jatrophihabitantaceae bacterium]